MSFSSDVKKELYTFYDSMRHCNIAEITAIINYEGLIYNNNSLFGIKIQTENKDIAVKFYNLIINVFKFTPDISIRKNALINKSHIYSVIINNSDYAFNILNAAGLLNNGAPVKKVDHIVIKSVCCKRAYIRGVFLCIGSLCNPEKTYHMEFVNNDYNLALQLKDLINSFDIDSKIIQRKCHFIVYIKDGEQIVDILNIISAHKSLLNLENVRIIKDLRNNVNRIVNCETANLNKIVSASVKQREEIEFISHKIGLDKLPLQLRIIAEARLDYPDLSLKELGETLVPPVGKSGVNHRLKKISTIAEKLREDYIL